MDFGKPTKQWSSYGNVGNNNRCHDFINLALKMIMSDRQWNVYVRKLWKWEIEEGKSKESICLSSCPTHAILNETQTNWSMNLKKLCKNVSLIPLFQDKYSFNYIYKYETSILI